MKYLSNIMPVRNHRSYLSISLGEVSSDRRLALHAERERACRLWETEMRVCSPDLTVQKSVIRFCPKGRWVRTLKVAPEVRILVFFCRLLGYHE